ncbi:SDR family oxidoreductase [Glycomyces mayteni]|uniref:SDR family oxidoreductase n=1 Tax=Glycomyces mayteni TaxID=543887 RepID=A0ABW2DA55_9ACTN|nr:SDR family oxidoreductase [Glycomyces mayteni]
MRVFITGGSGWIGSGVVPALIAAGHEVTGLARSDASAAALTAAGAAVRRGDIGDLAVLREESLAADAVVHLAFRHDIAFSGRFDEAVDADRAAAEAIGEALAGTGKVFGLASGVPVTDGAAATEADGHDLGTDASGPARRFAVAEYVLGLAERGVRSMVFRFPIVYGAGDPGFTATMIQADRDKGLAAWIGEGTNRWSGVHRDDAAELIRLAVENAPAGSTLHVVGDEGVAIRDLAAVVGERLGIPTGSVAPEDAAAHFGWLAGFLAHDRAASSEATRALLGWRPEHPSFLADLEEGHYFKS